VVCEDEAVVRDVEEVAGWIVVVVLVVDGVVREEDDDVEEVAGGIVVVVVLVDGVVTAADDVVVVVSNVVVKLVVAGPN
jgi:hypothetical protein